MVTHWIVVRVETPAGVTTQAVIEEVASNLQSVNELELTAGENVVAAVLDVEDSVRNALRRKTLLVCW